MTPDKTPSDAELLPCPFCGEAAKHSFNSLYGDMSMASCKSCGATAYAPKWNRRAVLAKWGTPVVAGEVAAHRVMRKQLDGNWVCDGRYWSDGPPSKELVESICSDKDRWRVDVAYTTPQPTQAQAGAVPLDEARRLFDAGWKAAALFCDREDVVADGIIGFGACPQFEAVIGAAYPLRGKQ